MQNVSKGSTDYGKKEGHSIMQFVMYEITCLIEQVPYEI